MVVVCAYWSPTAVKPVTGHTLSGRAQFGIIHLINSGPATLDDTGRQSVQGQPTMKPFWEIHQDEVAQCLQATDWCPAVDFFRGGGFPTNFTTRGGMPMTMARLNWIKGLGPVLQLAEGYTVELPEEVHDVLDRRSNPTWPTTWFVPNLTGVGPFAGVYSVMQHWGAN